MIYSYKALDEKGRLIEGETDAANESIVRKRLLNQNFTVIEVAGQGVVELFISTLKQSFGSSKSSVTKRERMEFYKEASTLLKIGLPIGDVIIQMSSVDTEDQGVRRVAQRVRQKLDEGERLSIAMRFSGFPVSVTETISVGEATGTLKKAFEAVIRQDELSTKIKKELWGIYLAPILSGTFMLMAFIGSILFMIPVQKQVIKNLESDPELYPPLSKITFWLGDYGILSIEILAAVVLILVVAIKIASAVSWRFNLFYDNKKMSIPFFGSFYRFQEYARICNLLSATVGSVKTPSLVTGLLRKQVSSPYLKDMMERMHTLVDKKGMRLSQAMSEVGFNSLITRFISRGEKSGSRDSAEILDDITRHYEEKTMNNLAVLKGLSDVSNMIILIVLSTPVLIIAVGPSIDQVTLMMNRL